MLFSLLLFYYYVIFTVYLHNRNWNVMFCILYSSLPGRVGEGVLQGFPQPSGRQEVFLWLSSISLPVFV